MAEPRPTRNVLVPPVLRRRDYRLLLTSFGLSRTGDLLYVVALVVYVYQATHSVAWVSAATLCRFVPTLVLSPFAGLLVDRYERRTMMILSDVAQLAATAAMTIAAVLAAPAIVVIALALLAAAAGTIYRAAASAMVQNVVPEDELAAANSLTSTVDTLTFVAGPAAGALVLLLGPPAVAFGINAASFAASALLLSAMRARARPGARTGPASTGRELRAGLTVLVGNPTITSLVGCFAASMFVYGVELVVLVQVSTDRIGTGPDGLGWLVAANGAGGLVGAALSARLARAARPRATIAVLVLLTGLPLASLALIGAPVPAYLVLLLEGAAVVALDVLIETALQRSVDPDLMGRVVGLLFSIIGVGAVLGTILAPILLDLLGLRATLALAGTVPVVLAAASLTRLQTLDPDTNRTRVELAPRVALLTGLRLLDGADPAAVERLAAAAAEEKASTGSVVLRQGDPADDLLVLVDGALGIDHRSGDTIRRVNELTAPDYLGEIGLLHRAPRTASAVATTDSVLWRIPGLLFLDAVGTGPGPSAALLAGVARRMARTPTAG